METKLNLLTHLSKLNLSMRLSPTCLDQTIKTITTWTKTMKFLHSLCPTSCKCTQKAKVWYAKLIKKSVSSCWFVMTCWVMLTNEKHRHVVSQGDFSITRCFRSLAIKSSAFTPDWFPWNQLVFKKPRGFFPSYFDLIWYFYHLSLLVSYRELFLKKKSDF